MSRVAFNSGFGHLAHIVAIMTGAVAFGFLAMWLNFPLPWMLGALVFSGTVRLLNFPVRVPVQTRQLGQILVASSVGLSFTPEALQLMGALAIPMVLAAILTIVLSFGVAGVLMRLTHVEASTAILATLPMGPVESAILAKKHGSAPGPVVFAQTMRIVLLVILIPPVIVLLDGSVGDPVGVLRAAEWTAQGAGLLFAFGLAGALLLRAIKMSNPFFLGALGGGRLGCRVWPSSVILSVSGSGWGADISGDLAWRRDRPRSVSQCAWLLARLCADFDPDDYPLRLYGHGTDLDDRPTLAGHGPCNRAGQCHGNGADRENPSGRASSRDGVSHRAHLYHSAVFGHYCRAGAARDGAAAGVSRCAAYTEQVQLGF